MKEKDEYDMLEYRYLNTRAKRGGAPKVEKKPDVETKAEEKPEIHVHVQMPEVKAEEKKDAPPTESPRRWKFTHKYDKYNKLTETVAEAQ